MHKINQTGDLIPIYIKRIGFKEKISKKMNIENEVLYNQYQLHRLNLIKTKETFAQHFKYY